MASPSLPVNSPFSTPIDTPTRLFPNAAERAEEAEVCAMLLESASPPSFSTQDDAIVKRRERSPAAGIMVPMSQASAATRAPFGSLHSAARGIRRRSVESVAPVQSQIAIDPNVPRSQRQSIDGSELVSVDVDESELSPETPERQDGAPAYSQAAFRTPPHHDVNSGERSSVGGAVASALGGAPPRSGAQRIRIENSPWKVPATPTSRRGERLPISDEKRRLISERRRSAAKAPDMFFAGGVPGMSPARSSSVKAAVPRPECWRGGNYSFADKENGEEQDLRSVLKNLQETVEGLKRRRDSVLAGVRP
ncbi:hypothetical protein B0H14DRAFT_2842414 [Mycena olivaceomarginata]|nr:hypothetical protein B0H14DRAFT_2842414 [Mycena olivaceomarginata]